MEIRNRNPFVTDRLAARRAVPTNRNSRPGNFDAALESAEESAEEKKAEEAAKAAQSESEQDMDYRKFLLDKMEEMRTKIKNGTIQPKIQIGAEAYTEEEWQKLLDKIDAAEETIKEQVEAEIEAAKAAVKEEENDAETRIITRADGARILIVKTAFGEISVELHKPDGSVAAYGDQIRDLQGEQDNVNSN